MALADDLEGLATRAHAVAQKARDAAAKGRADLEAKVAEARSSADQHAQELGTRSKDRSGDAGSHWHDMQRSWKEHVAHTRKQMDATKADVDSYMAQRDAESALSDALDALDFAASAVDEAGYAVLNAELAKIKADELAE